MPRPIVTVRDASMNDAGQLLPLWMDLVSSSGLAARSESAPTLDGAVRRIAEVALSPDRRLLVADLDDAVAGMAYVEVSRVTPLHDTRAVHLAYLHVARAARRRGVGHALMSETVAWAAVKEADHVVVDVHPGDREAHRFCARLGLTQLHVQRMGTVAQVRRRLVSDAVPDGLPRPSVLRNRVRQVISEGRAKRSAENLQPSDGA